MAGDFGKSGVGIICESVDFEGRTLSLATTANHKFAQLMS
jgi:hypothetical protein